MKVISLNQDEKELIRLAVEKNRQAQQQIYTKFSPKMLSVCRQYIKDLQEAEDVLITAFMKVFTNLNSFEHKGSFEGWIRRIIINECISFIRAKKQLKFIDEENFHEESTFNTESNLTVEEIQVLIDNLPNGYRLVFNLYVIEGYKHREIANLLGITEGTSKSQLSHARKMLQEQLNNQKNYYYETK